jgi:acyl dehydratase
MGEAQGEVVRQRGLWFEELRAGVVYKHSPGRTIGEADNTLFSTLTMNPQSLHLDAAFSETTEFGERLVNSLLTMSVLVGLSVGHLTQGTIVANLGFGDTRFPAPVRHGDTIYGETAILDKRLSASRPGQGIVKFEHTARNQHGEVVAVMTRTTLMRCKPSAEGQPSPEGQPAPEARPSPEGQSSSAGRPKPEAE